MSEPNLQELRRLLPNHIPSVARGLRTLGKLPGNRILHLTLGLAYRNRDELTKLLKNIYDPASPMYRRYLKPAEFTRWFCPNEADYRLVSSFATSNGLALTGTSANRTLLYVKAPAQTIEAAFHTSLHSFRHPKTDRVFFAPDTEPSIPDTLPLLDITGLDDAFDPAAERRRNGTPRKIEALSGSGPLSGFTATDLRA